MSQSIIQDIQNKLNEKKISCVQLVREKIAALQSSTKNANNLILDEQALEQAKIWDEKIASGHILSGIEGIPFGVKDVYLLKGTISTASSNILKNYKSPYTATAIQKLIDAGAIPICKENCDQFGHGSTNENSVFGVAKNAHNDDKVAGGSSGGSAVNVAEGNTVFSIGGDTGGSIRQPAGYNKVYGLKPTYGRVSRYGLMAYTSSSDCVGPFANTVKDIATTLNVMSGKDGKDQTTLTSTPIDVESFDSKIKAGTKIGVYKSFIDHPSLESKIKTDFNSLIEKLKEKGVEIKELDFFDGDTLTATYYIIALAETASNLSRIDGIAFGNRAMDKENLALTYLDTRGEGFSQETKRRIIAGNQVLSVGYSEEIYKKALEVRKGIEAKFAKDFEEVDFVLSPTSPLLPPTIGESLKDPLTMYLSDMYTVGFSLGGLPTLSAPFVVENNVQITAAKEKDEEILRFAYAIEQSL
ncbi:MAG: Asp-tRNA(Asn)/Glu-tRNA(Gln) amidotransferase GatCAB subunit A [Flavobacteriales bacterium]|nr:Asp-tRNA(Asn)/Glu-tRNA(Gln) amidotransferase GatCAB subunit A [Flavobacteriales bacterium]MBO72832.1 Asp-tRNA(Asn)/Glu-tRNA(Gln) amidotransferase GatCAB subunit A [Flavobacteriales bacterium]|tara:strand:+ start:36831 stop:38240 length:1410 start_codon:yes stop_codon:yes gene_type:complete